MPAAHPCQHNPGLHYGRELLLQRLLGVFCVRAAVRGREELREQQEGCDKGTGGGGGGECRRRREQPGEHSTQHYCHALWSMMLSMEDGGHLQTGRLGDFVKTEDWRDLMDLQVAISRVDMGRIRNSNDADRWIREYCNSTSTELTNLIPVTNKKEW